MLPFSLCFLPPIQQLVSRYLNTPQHSYLWASAALHQLSGLPASNQARAAPHPTYAAKNSLFIRTHIPCSDNLLSKSSHVLLPDGWQVTHQGELCLPEYSGVN